MNKLDRDAKPAVAGTTSADPAAESPDLPAARKYLTDVLALPAAAVEAMPPARVVLLYLASYYRERRDDVFKAAYLPFPKSQPSSAAADERLKAAPDTEAGRLAKWFLPAIPRVMVAQTRLERRLAAQQAVEALRLHAAAAGRLPDALGDIKAVPVPDDPATGKPFEYACDGTTATITSRIPGEPLPSAGLRFRVTLRK